MYTPLSKMPRRIQRIPDCFCKAGQPTLSAFRNRTARALPKRPLAEVITLFGLSFFADQERAARIAKPIEDWQSSFHTADRGMQEFPRYGKISPQPTAKG